MNITVGKAKESTNKKEASSPFKVDPMSRTLNKKGLK